MQKLAILTKVVKRACVAKTTVKRTVISPYWRDKNRGDVSENLLAFLAVENDLFHGVLKRLNQLKY